MDLLQATSAPADIPGDAPISLVCKVIADGIGEESLVAGPVGHVQGLEVGFSFALVWVGLIPDPDLKRWVGVLGKAGILNGKDDGHVRRGLIDLAVARENQVDLQHAGADYGADEAGQQGRRGPRSSVGRDAHNVVQRLSKTGAPYTNE